MPVTVPTKTDGSIGREKREQPLNALLPVDLDYYETAEEREAQKDTLIELAEAINDLESEVGGGGVLYEMPIATASVGTPARIRASSDTPAVPAGTAAKSVVPWTSYVTKSALRLSATGMDGGGLIWPIVHGLGDLPDGYTVELWLSGLDSMAGGLTAVVFPMCRFFASGGAYSTVEGYAFKAYAGFSQIDRETVDMVSTVYTRMLGAGVGNAHQWPSAPNFNREPAYLRVDVRHTPALTPARFLLQSETRVGGLSTTPIQWGHGSVDDPLTQFDGKTLRDIGIGVFGTGDMDIDIARLRIRALD